MECRVTAEFDLISLSVQLFVCCEICHIEELKITERLKDMNTDGCVIHLESHILTYSHRNTNYLQYTFYFENAYYMTWKYVKSWS